MDRTTNFKAMCAVNSAIECTPISDQNSLVSLRKVFYMHFIIESVLSERIALIPVSSLRESIL